MSVPTIRRAGRITGFVVALACAGPAPLKAEYYRWPPPPLPGPPYPYMPNYPYPNVPPYSGCPGGYITIGGDICEPYFPLTNGAPRKVDGCPRHYKRVGALCQPTRS